MCVASKQELLLLYRSPLHGFFVIPGADEHFVGIRILLHLDSALDDDRDTHHVDSDGKDRDKALHTRIGGDAHGRDRLSGSGGDSQSGV